jgi:hypothetical protein
MLSPAFCNPHSSSPPPNTNLPHQERGAEDVLASPLPTLILTSHGHSPPLRPIPQLKFDVRALPNPPKQVRDAHNGTSRRLQEWLYADSSFMTRRNEIRSAIESSMANIMQQRGRDPMRSLRSGSKSIENPTSPDTTEVNIQLKH